MLLRQGSLKWWFPRSTKEEEDGGGGRKQKTRRPNPSYWAICISLLYEDVTWKLKFAADTSWAPFLEPKFFRETTLTLKSRLKKGDFSMWENKWYSSRTMPAWQNLTSLRWYLQTRYGRLRWQQVVCFRHYATVANLRMMLSCHFGLWIIVLQYNLVFVKLVNRKNNASFVNL